MIDESNAIAADVIGTGRVTKVRYTIEVPDGIQFDEFQLWKSGVLDLSLSDLKVYYPFMEDADSSCSSLLGCDGQLVSNNASVAPVVGGGISVGQYVHNISNLVDNNIDSYMSVGNTLQVGEAVLLNVGLGQTIDPSHQVGIIIDNKTYLAGISAGGWLTIELYRKVMNEETGVVESVATGDKFTNWQVVNANVAGFGDKNALYFTPTKPFDELQLNIAGIANVTDEQRYYGILTRGDSDQDGIPDCMDQSFTVKDPTTGIGQIITDPGLVVAVNGSNVNVTCKTGISTLVAYNMEGRVVNAAVGNNSAEMSLTLPRGMYALLIEFADGTATAVKLAI